MCAKKSVATSGCGNAPDGSQPSSVRGNTVRSRYRVLRAAMGRPIPRSVNRDCAGRNATSVKGSSPDKHLISVVAEQVLSSEGNTGELRLTGTTGVQAHGMYRRRLLELGRSPQRRSRTIVDEGQGLNTKSDSMRSEEVRWTHSSETTALTRKEVG